MPYVGIKTTYSGGAYLTATGSNGKRCKVAYEFKYGRRENHLRAAGYFVGKFFGSDPTPHVQSVEWKDHYQHTVEVRFHRAVGAQS
jgi:hypothetical protein